MKHIQKIVKIACILKDKWKFTDEEIYNFIIDVSAYTNKMRLLNERLLFQDKFSPVVEARATLEQEIKAFFYDDLMEGRLHLSHNVMECPVRLEWGKEYANYEDNKSFVIDL